MLRKASHFVVAATGTALALLVQLPSRNAEAASSDTYRQLNLFGDVFEKLRTDYIQTPDDGKLIEFAMNGMLAGAGISTTVSREQVFCSSGPNADATYIVLQCFGNLFEQVRAQVDGRVSEAELISSALKGMLRGLDAHSKYIDAKSFSDMQRQTPSQLGGLGIDVTMEGDLIKVVSLIDDGPASKAGILPDDIITQIDGSAVQGLTLEQFVTKIKGAINTTAKLAIVRKGRDAPFDVAITREIVRVHPVHSRVDGGNIGYIRITSFNEQTAEDLHKAITDFTNAVPPDKLAGYVVDLRNNPGGLLNQAVLVASTFMQRGEIGLSRGRDETQRFTAHGGDLTKGKPLIVLINGGSASGSEIVAGALQDHKRATLIGTRSFGKGSVQTLIPLGSGNGMLQLTTSRFYTPSGKSFDSTGIVPDVEVVQDDLAPSNGKNDKALQTAISLLEGNVSYTALPANSKGKAPGSQSVAAAPAIEPAASGPRATASLGRRVALVLGNSSYKFMPTLRNPKNDATDVANAFRHLGFETVLATDLDRMGMNAAVSQFSRIVTGADVAIVYYSGHGMQFAGKNYLLPVDANLESAADVNRFQLMPVDDLIDMLGSAKGLQLIVLDACRNNPVERDFKNKVASTASGYRDVSSTRGFSRIDPRNGLVITYATASNDVAADGSGRNSPFTQAFLKNVVTPDLDVRQMLFRVQNDVYASSGSQQLPEISSLYVGPDIRLVRSTK